MMSPKTQTIIATTTIALTSSIAIALIPTKAAASGAVLVFIAIMICVWNGTKLFVKRKCPQTEWFNSKHRHEILFAIILASLLLLGSMIATVAKQLELLDQDTIKRIIGINTGIMLIVLGNYMPKKSSGSSGSCNCDTIKSSRIQRFMGWIFVLGGIMYTLSWIIFDPDQAGTAILFAFPVAIMIIFALRILYIRSTRTKNQLEQSV